MYGQMRQRYPFAWGDVGREMLLELGEPIADSLLALYCYICIMSYAEDFHLTDAMEKAKASGKASETQPMLNAA